MTALFEGLAGLARLLRGRAIGPDRGGMPGGYRIDSRKLAAGDLFFALPGTQTDGHRFLPDATARGAWGAVVSDPAAAAASGLPCVVVEDVAEAMIALAEAKRATLRYPMVAVTGSNGKTTTKDLVAAFLGRSRRVVRTPGNLNNLLGLPLALMEADPGAEVGVFELGMSTRGEIDRLARLLKPRFGVITCVAPAHLETLGTLEQVREAKAELIPHLDPDGFLYLNGDDPSTAELARRAAPRTVRKVSLGGLVEAQAMMRVERVGIDGTDGVVVVDRPDLGRQEKMPVHWPLPGRHLVYPLLFAILIARDLGLPVKAGELASLVQGLEATRGRMRVLDLGGRKLVDDAYNANPRSVEAAIDWVEEVEVPGRRFLVLGDMLELGPVSEVCHRAVRERVAASRRLAGAWFVGPIYAGLADRAEEQMSVAERRDRVVAEVLARFEPGDLLLVKGSRGIGLDRVVDAVAEAHRSKESGSCS